MANKIEQRKEYLKTTVEMAISMYKSFRPVDIDPVMLAKMCLTIVEAADCLAEEDEEFARVWGEHKSNNEVQPPNTTIKLDTNIHNIKNKGKSRASNKNRINRLISKPISKKQRESHEHIIPDSTDKRFATVSGTNTISCSCDACGREMKAVRRELDAGERIGFLRTKLLEDTFVCSNEYCTRHAKVTYTQRIEDNFCTVYHYTIKGCKLYNEVVDEDRPEMK